MNQRFLTIKDVEGNYLPRVEIRKDTEFDRAQIKFTKLEEGDKIVVVEFKEVEEIK